MLGQWEHGFMCYSACLTSQLLNWAKVRGSPSPRLANSNTVLSVFLDVHHPPTHRTTECVCCTSPACSSAETYDTMQHLFFLTHLTGSCSCGSPSHHRGPPPHSVRRQCCPRITTASSSRQAMICPATCGPSLLDPGSVASSVAFSWCSGS